MADIKINVDHHHDYTRADPGANFTVPTSTNWIACGAGHANCTHSSYMSDTVQIYGTSAQVTGNKGIQTGDIRINKTHAHTYTWYRRDTSVNVIAITWQNCPAGHTKCQYSSQITRSGCFKTSSLQNATDPGSQQSGGDIVVNYWHFHDNGFHAWKWPAVEGGPATCPLMHPMCQQKVGTADICGAATSHICASEYEA